MVDHAAEQAKFWERRADAWERRADEIGAFSDVYGAAAMDALAPAPGERILDIGCGPGVTTVELARRVGSGGEAVGVDLSEGMIAAARRRTAGADLPGLRFVMADAQTQPLGEGFDAVYSRFGVMFFPDPAAAFANIAEALRPGGRLAWAVWGSLADNPWMFVPTLAAAPVLGADLALPGPGEPGPFSLAEPDHVEALLAGAGLTEVRVAEVAGARVITLTHADDDVRMLLEVGPLGEAYAAADDPTRAAAVAAVLEAIEGHRDGDGWRLPGKGLTVVARRPG